MNSAIFAKLNHFPDIQTKFPSIIFHVAHFANIKKDFSFCFIVYGIQKHLYALWEKLCTPVKFFVPFMFQLQGISKRPNILLELKDIKYIFC